VRVTHVWRYPRRGGKLTSVKHSSDDVSLIAALSDEGDGGGGREGQRYALEGGAYLFLSRGGTFVTLSRR